MSNAAPAPTNFLYLHLRNLCLFLLVFTLCGSVFAQIVYREVQTTGYGLNVSEAIIDALENALSQVNGQRLVTSTALRVSATNIDGANTLDESFNREVQKATRGIVKSYEVRSTGVADDGRAFAKVSAVIPSYKNSPQLDRLRLSIVSAITGSQLAADPKGKKFIQDVTLSLEAYLTETRKFAILDRRFIQLSDKELSGLSSPKSAIEESVRLGVRATADYIVIVGLRDFNLTTSTVRRLSGKIVEKITAPSTIDLRVIDISSGQIKFAQTYSTSGLIPLGASVDRLAFNVATDLGESINFAIYPVSVLSSQQDGTLTLNQGGQTVQVGRYYRLVKLGKDLIDPYTKEALGREEIYLGKIEIVSTTAKTALARQLTGTKPTEIRSGSLILRPFNDTQESEPDVLKSNQTTPLLLKKKSDDW